MTNNQNPKTPALGAGDPGVLVGHESANNSTNNDVGSPQERLIIANLLTIYNEVGWADLMTACNRIGHDLSSVLFLPTSAVVKPGEAYFWEGPITPKFLSKAAREKTKLFLMIPDDDMITDWLDASYEAYMSIFGKAEVDDKGFIRIGLETWRDADGTFTKMVSVRSASDVANALRSSFRNMPKITCDILSRHIPPFIQAHVYSKRNVQLVESPVLAMNDAQDVIMNWVPKGGSND